jgi:hypothetical protein
MLKLMLLNNITGKSLHDKLVIALVVNKWFAFQRIHGVPSLSKQAVKFGFSLSTGIKK